MYEENFVLSPSDFSKSAENPEEEIKGRGDFKEWLMENFCRLPAVLY
ncbi:MAG: hypothetical protein J6O39_04150 [Treponema sp.]|nr:hypothetical protein [Treponema sp.]